MNLYLWAIRSNGFGLPYSGRGQIGHIVLTGDDPNMPVVLELSGGGRYPGYDCCPSATRSALRYFGLTDPGAVRVEELEHTAPPLGTFISNVPAAARALGMSSSNVQFGTPPGRYVMNPMLRSVVARTPDYDANSQGVYVTFSGRPAAIPVAGTSPTGGTIVKQRKEHMDMIILVAKSGGAYVVSGSSIVAENDKETLDNLKAAGVPQAVVEATLINELSAASQRKP